MISGFIDSYPGWNHFFIQLQLSITFVTDNLSAPLAWTFLSVPFEQGTKADADGLRPNTGVEAGLSNTGGPVVRASFFDQEDLSKARQAMAS
jgi:hypothetical protein